MIHDDQSILSVKESGPILEATMMREHVLNAINFDMMAAFENMIQYIETTPEIRVFMLRGKGKKAFVSGGDLKAFKVLKSETDAHDMSLRMGNILKRLETLDCWTMALINGDAYGGGCELLLGFDFRIAAKHARFGFTQAKFGLTPGWGGLTRLVHQVGRRRALDLLGRAATIDSKTALDIGLIDRVSDFLSLEQEASDWAKSLTHFDRDIIGYLKSGASDACIYPKDQSMDKERAHFKKLWAHPRHHQKVENFF